MNIISIGDAIFIWDVLVWTTPRPDTIPLRSALDNHGQPRNPPEPFQYTTHTARALTRSVSNSELEKTTIRPEEKKKSSTIPTGRRHFIQRINHSHLAKVILIICPIFSSNDLIFRNVMFLQLIKRHFVYNQFLVTMAMEERILFGMLIVVSLPIVLVVMSL